MLFANDWRAFSLESDDWFSIQTTGNGEINIKGDSVTVKLHSALISGTDKIIDKRTITKLQVGIAYYKSKDSWLVSSLSSPQEINKTIQANTNIIVPSFETSFIVPENILNKEHWVVLQMTIVDKEGKEAYVFTHEPS